MSTQRQILHIDMNAFYASCHQAAEPNLYAKRPIAVAGNPKTRHGVIVTASYEARARGIRTTMTVPVALRLCPELQIIRPDFVLYRQYAKKVFDIVRRFTPLVEIVSIDECYADVSGSRQFGDGVTIAQTIQKTILQELRLPCSIGVADCKFFAKMGSNLKKPRGITVINQTNFRQLLWPLPVDEMHGVGKQTAQKCQALGIRTIGQLAAAKDTLLHNEFGLRGRELKQLAAGVDTRPVNPVRPPSKSVGHSITLPQDERTIESLRVVLLNLADQVGRRLRKQQKCGRVVTLTIRYNNRHTFTRQKHLPHATDLTEQIYEASWELLQTHWDKQRPVRLLGVTISELSDKTHTEQSGLQLNLFDTQATEKAFAKVKRLEKLTAVADQLRNRFGEQAIIRGRMLQSDDSNALRNHRTHGTSLQKDQLYGEES